MPRQNQDHGSYVRGVAGVTPVLKGGTGAPTSVEAVDNLNGLHRSDIDKVNGLAMTDGDGYLKAEYFGHLDIFVGPRIKGPRTLYRGCSARFQVMNFATERLVQVTIDGYEKSDLNFVAQGGLFAFTVPTDAAVTSMSIKVQYDGRVRVLTLPVQAPSINAPSVITPNDSIFNTEVWIELEAPVYNGLSEFDSYIETAPGEFRGNTITANNSAGTHTEFQSYTGHVELSVDYPFAEFRIAGRLKSADGFAYALIDGRRYDLTDVYDEFTIKPKNSLKVEVFTSIGEEIWVAFIRPYLGNRSATPYTYTYAVIETAENMDGPWTPAVAPFLCDVKDGLSFRVTGLPIRTLWFRVKYVYTADGTTIESPYSELFTLTIVNEKVPLKDQITAPYALTTTEFGKSVLHHTTPEGEELFIGGNLSGLGNVVFHYRVIGGGMQYLEPIVLPIEETRAAGEGFADRIAMSEDGRYLFVSAPSAAFSDVTGTTGAVYIYERYLDFNFILVKRLMDVNRLYPNFGRDVAQVGNLLVVLTGSTLTQAPNLCFYQLETGDVDERFVLKRTETMGQAGEVNIANLAIPQYFDTVMSKYPLILRGAMRDPATAEIKQVRFTYVLDAATTTLSLVEAPLFTPVVTDLFGADANGIRYVLSYLGIDPATGHHVGNSYGLQPTTRTLYSGRWTMPADGSTVIISADSFVFSDYVVSGSEAPLSDFDISKNQRYLYVGSSGVAVEVDTEAGPVTQNNAGLLYQITVNNLPF